MRDKSSKTVLMNACEHIYGEASVACADSADMSTVNERFFFHVIDRREVIQHVLAGIVTGNLSVPFCAETGETAAVGSYDHISV